MVRCPECKKNYNPAPRVKFDPNEPWLTEQHITGLCSDKCFDESISGSRPEYTYDERGRRFENRVRKPFADMSHGHRRPPR